MSRAISFIGVILVLAVGMIYYVNATKAVSPTHGAPTATVETVGVEQDLLAIANAERRYNATNGKYVSLEELISSGEISMPHTSRGPYNYSVDVDGDSFVARAHADRPLQGAPSNVSVDGTMAVFHD